MGERRFLKIRLDAGNREVDKVVIPKETIFKSKTQCLSCKGKFKDEVKILDDVYFGDGDEEKKLQFVCPDCGETSLYEISSRILKTWFYVGDRFVVNKPKCSEEEKEYLKKVVGADEKANKILERILED